MSYLYVIDGRVSLDVDSLRTGDAAKVTGEVEVALATEVGAELIFVDVPMGFESVGIWAEAEGGAGRVIPGNQARHGQVVGQHKGSA